MLGYKEKRRHKNMKMHAGRYVYNFSIKTNSNYCVAQPPSAVVIQLGPKVRPYSDFYKNARSIFTKQTQLDSKPYCYHVFSFLIPLVFLVSFVVSKYKTKPFIRIFKPKTGIVPKKPKIFPEVSGFGKLGRVMVKKQNKAIYYVNVKSYNFCKITP